MPKTRSMNFNNQEDEIIATAFTVQGNNAPAGTSQDGVQGPLIPRVLTGYRPSHIKLEKSSFL